MNEALNLIWAWVAGALLGVIFFGGLWWTVHQGVLSERPALWFSGSLVLRTSVVLVGFYMVSDGHWKRLLVGLLGFIAARFIMIRLTRTSAKPTRLAPETDHAS